MLYDKGLLLSTVITTLRLTKNAGNYTQNIDMLERKAGMNAENLFVESIGIPENVLVEAHGTWSTAHCIECNENYDMRHLRGNVLVMSYLYSLLHRCCTK